MDEDEKNALVQAAVAKALNKAGGDKDKAITLLTRLALKTAGELADAKAKVPADDAVVLRGDDAKQWERYRALGDPKEVKAKLDAVPDLEAELGDFRHGRTVAQVAEVAGLKPGPLAKLLPKGSPVELADETVDGKTVKVAKVKVGDVLTPVTGFIETNYGAEVLAGIRVEAEAKPATRAATPPPGSPVRTQAVSAGAVATPDAERAQARFDASPRYAGL